MAVSIRITFFDFFAVVSRTSSKIATYAMWRFPYGLLFSSLLQSFRLFRSFFEDKVFKKQAYAMWQFPYGLLLSTLSQSFRQFR